MKWVDININQGSQSVLAFRAHFYAKDSYDHDICFELYVSLENLIEQGNAS